MRQPQEVKELSSRRKKGIRSDGVREPQSWRSKTGISIASPSLVTLTTYDVPADMVDQRRFEVNPGNKYEFKGRGIILESDVVAYGDPTYKSIIIAPAHLFKRSNDTPPHQVQFDVSSPDGKLIHKMGELVACDFHYNLAAVSILTDFPLKPATLATLSDVSSIDGDAYRHYSLLVRHSGLFLVQPGTKIIVLSSSFDPPFSVYPASGVFRASHFVPHSCKELYWVSCRGITDNHSGGAVISRSGQLLGILCQDSAFLPSNFISRWWRHFKTTIKFCRPWVGVEIANLIEAPLSFLTQFQSSFSDTSAGVIVTKIEKGTPAYRAGIRLEDVIVSCDGKCVGSKIEFFEMMWDYAGKSVKLAVLRPSDGQRLELRMSIRETAPSNFHSWKLPRVSETRVPDVSSDKLSNDGAPSAKT